MRNLKHHIVKYITRLFSDFIILSTCGLMFILHFLPMSIIAKCGVMIGTVMYYIAKHRRHVVMVNLNLCFPNMTQVEKRNIAKQNFCYASRALFEYSLVLYGSEKQIKSLVKMKNLDIVLKYHGKRQIILLCPHFFGLDVGALRLTMEAGGYSLYAESKSKLLTKLLKRARSRFNKNRGGEIFPRHNGWRKLLQSLLSTNAFLFYLPDQDCGPADSIFIPFFAHQYCATINTLPRLVEKLNAVVIPCVIHAVGNTYEMEFHSPWENYPTGDIYQDTLYMNQFIEKAVSQYMPQYLWLHKRFKTQPNMARGKLYE
jgi:KDO2-lipid IV(A) lauroyltransferase